MSSGCDSAAFDAAVDPERRAVYDVEYRTIGKEDGVFRWVAAKGRGVFDDAGNCAFALLGRRSMSPTEGGRRWRSRELNARRGPHAVARV